MTTGGKGVRNRTRFQPKNASFSASKANYDIAATQFTLGLSARPCHSYRICDMAAVANVHQPAHDGRI
jgi:hypothetical protein